MYVPVLETALLSRALATSPLTVNTSVQIPTSKPPYAERLSPYLAGFSIEMDRWTDWAGDEIGKPNEYVNQLLSNLGQRTGKMPFLRVGGEYIVQLGRDSQRLHHSKFTGQGVRRPKRPSLQRYIPTANTKRSQSRS